MYRPQFVFPVSTDCIDQKSLYSFDQTNVPLLSSGLIPTDFPGNMRIPLPLDQDADVFIRAIQISPRPLKIGLLDPYNNSLLDAGQGPGFDLDGLPQTIYPYIWGQTNGAGIVVLEGDNWGVYCRAGSSLSLYLQNTGVVAGEQSRDYSPCDQTLSAGGVPMTSTGLQERHQDYVLGPNQDGRLANVAAGAFLEAVQLQLDSDAPFVMRSRCTYCQYNTANSQTQGNLQLLKTRLAGPLRDYRSLEYVAESAQMAYFGLFGNPKPIYPAINYPANGLITIDVYNAGALAIQDLTFVFRGVKTFPLGSIPGYTYPASFAAKPYSYQIDLPGMAVISDTGNQVFKVRTDGDFVIRAGQASDILIRGDPCTQKHLHSTHGFQ